MAKGCGCRFVNGCDTPQTLPVPQEPERNLAIVAPTDRVQTYEGNLVPSATRRDLANWSWVRLSNTRARLTINSNNRPECRQHRPCDNTGDRTLDETGDHSDPDSTEEHDIPSDEEEPGLEDLE